MATPTNAQLSPYSSLADALTPWVKPYYELPQDAYHPDARITSSSGIAPIFFPLYKHYIFTPYVTLNALLGNLQVLKAIMASGSDLVFKEREGTVRLDLRVMVCLLFFRPPLIPRVNSLLSGQDIMRRR